MLLVPWYGCWGDTLIDSPNILLNSINKVYYSEKQQRNHNLRQLLHVRSFCMLHVYPTVVTRQQWRDWRDLPATGPTGLRISKRALRGLWRGPLRTSGMVPRARALQGTYRPRQRGGWSISSGEGGTLNLIRCGDAEMAHVNRGSTDTKKSGHDEQRDAELQAPASRCLPTGTGEQTSLAL